MTIRNELSQYFRQRRAGLLRNVIQEIGRERGSVSILDVGGRPQFWDSVGLNVLGAANARVTILNLHKSELDGGRDIFRSVTGDACNLQYSHGEFDLVHSNSVIEHVGNWSNMKAFASEARRVGKSYFIQTPYFWFPIDPHFYAMPMFHWMPEPIKGKMLYTFPLATVGRLSGIDEAFTIVERTQLLDASRMRFLFPDATVRFEKFFGLPKSMIAIKI